MDKKTYRDREGALHFNITINEVELTALCSGLRHYIIENSDSKIPIISQRVSLYKEILKDLEDNA